MKILLLHNYFSYLGGEDLYHDSLKKLLEANDNKVIEFTKNSREIIKKTILAKFLVAKRLYWSKSIGSELSKTILREKPQIAHFNNIFPLITPLAYRICGKLGLPIVQTVHDYRYICPGAQLFKDGRMCDLCLGKDRFYFSLFYGCYHHSRLASFFFATSLLFHKVINSFRYINKFIFPSDFSRSIFLKNSDMPKEKTITIPYFVKADSKKAEKKDYFLFVGRFSEEKGIINLLEMFSKMPNLKLVVIGDGPLNKKVHRYKNYKNILIQKFLPRFEVFRYMRSAKATIIPSLFYETGPMVLLESFANNTPVIVPKFGSFKEAVQDGQTGLFYKQYDFDDLKTKIVYASKNTLLMRKMGIAARKEYEIKYTPKRHYETLMEIYRSLI